ncbi:MAG TPA: carbohydrate kinase family protein [Vitreimonas sp.]|nr:carbohydrate kinase family protein [Vitreimonas sp.]
MFDVLTIGTAVVDIFIHSPELKVRREENQEWLCQLYGEKLTVSDLAIHSGGAATNTAVGFQRLGFKTACIAELGKDFLATKVLEELHQAQIETKLLVREKLEQTGGSVILVGEDGGRTALVYRGASAQLDPQDLAMEEISTARWLHLSSIGGRLETLTTLFKALKHYQRHYSWNPGRAELELLTSGQLAITELSAQVLLLNQEEWHTLAPVQPQLQQQIERIVVTNGDQGGVLLERGQAPYQYSAAQVSSLDDTGAGDAFGTGFVAGLLSGKTSQEALNWGVHNSASVVQHVGAKPGLLTRAQLEASFR